MSDFYTQKIKTSKWFASPARCSDPGMLEPTTRRKVLAILGDLTKHGEKFMVYETYRSCERQAELYRQGATELETVGVHHYGLAADLVRVENGEPSWEGDFSLLWKLAHVHGLITGHDWGFPDRPHAFRDSPHLQRIAVADQERLFAGTWYPDSSYDPYDHLEG